MGTIALLGLAASVSLLAGWRVYACVLATGLAMRLGWIAPPSAVPDLGVLANWWVLGIAGLGFLAEFFVDKVAWADSLWDAIHTAIRPIGGALLALAIVNANDPVWQVVTLLLGGSAALAAHGAKAGTRAVVNMSPEPVSNVVVSTGEDVATTALLGVAFANPAIAAVVALAIAAGCGWLVWKARAVMQRLRRPRGAAAPPA